MDHNRKFLGVVTIALLLTILMGLAGAPVLGRQPERVKVLIGFAQRPGPAEQALVRRAGGAVRYRYRLVPAIAATVPETAIAHLRANPSVVRVEPDLRMRALDQELENAWGVTRIGAGTVHTTDPGNKGDGISIAIIDSGINYAHPDLDDNYAGGYNFVNLGADPSDVYGHGTHVAGTACAEDNDNGDPDPDGPYGVVGVAPACDLYSLRVLDDNGYGYSSDLVAALDWAVSNTLQVANLSLGWDQDPGETVEQAFNAAEEAGMVIVAAACNNGNPPGRGENVCWPGKYSAVIAVAATDANDRRASFSSTGTEVELAAPGASVFSTWNDETGYATPDPVCGADANGEYGCYKYGSGTSMASPHVAGVAALILAANPDWSNHQVRAQLKNTADDLGDAGWDPHYGYGLVNAVEAAAPAEPAEPVTDIAIVAVHAPESVALGDLVDVSVTVQNVGDQDVADDIAVTLKDATTDSAIDTQTLTGGLSAVESTTLTFIWDTAGASEGDHVLVASHDYADDDTSNDVQSTVVTLSEQPVGLDVTKIDPDTLVAGSTADIVVSGSGFAEGATLTFEGGAGAAPEASKVVVVSGSEISAAVAVKSGGPPKVRVWDVRVTNPDGSSAVLAGGLTVTP